MRNLRRGLVFLSSSFSIRRSVSAFAATGGTMVPSHLLDRIEASFLAGLVGDSLALGGHYEYDASKIKQNVGRYTDFLSPGEGMGGKTHGVGWGSANYHPGKKGGDLTDAGEIAIFLLDYLVNTKGFYEFDGFAQHWLNEIQQGYGSCNFQTVLADGSCPPGSKPGINAALLFLVFHFLFLIFLHNIISSTASHPSL